MTLLLKEDKIDKKTIGNIAKIVADFHSKAQTTQKSTSSVRLKSSKPTGMKTFLKPKIHQPNNIRKRVRLYSNQNQQLHGKQWCPLC
jgi:aminoglycoside phosphotransferase family enzyme